jgi:hypothetical protein
MNQITAVGLEELVDQPIIREFFPIDARQAIGRKEGLGILKTVIALYAPACQRQVLVSIG